MPRYKITLEYDGTPFSGWQKQKDAPSVQETLEKALYIFTKEHIDTFASGRTDTGVHAFGQVVHFDLPNAVNTYKLREGLNALMRPNPVSVVTCEETDDTFHARFDARERTYLYCILNRRSPSPILQNRVWHVSLPLDMEEMKKAAALLIGKHDFSTFRAAECQAKSPIKTMDSIEITKENDLIKITLKARSFLHHQVRNIAGALEYVGCGRWTVAQFEKAFHAKDRTKGAVTAPAAGLYFMKVKYPSKEE